MFYRSPEKSVCADVIPFYENGTYYLFYLRDYRDIKNHGEGSPWCLLTTKDLVHYVDHGPILERGGADEQDLYVFTGSVIKSKGLYYIFYTGHNPHFPALGKAQEKILMAVSEDLLHWKKVKDFAFGAPDYLEPDDFRDPFVYRDEKNNQFCMLLAARSKSGKPTNSNGITVRATSPDLYHWTLEKEPFYAPNAFFTHECPELFQIGEYWYLAFSEFTDKILTTYRVSKSPRGPWKTLKVNTFDGHAFYAAKGTFAGTKRINFGWDPIKNGETDDAPWQWGGTIVPHELVQDPSDGTLYVKCPQAVLDAYRMEKTLSPWLVVGKATSSQNAFALGNEGLSIVKLGALPRNCKITCDFTLSDDIGVFGLMLRGSEDYSRYYAVKFEPKMNRLGFDRLPRHDGCLHTEVDVERYCPLALNVKHHLAIILEDSVYAVFVDDKYAMCGRCFTSEDGNLSLFAQDQGVAFTDVRLWEEAK